MPDETVLEAIIAAVRTGPEELNLSSRLIECLPEEVGQGTQRLDILYAHYAYCNVALTLL